MSVQQTSAFCPVCERQSRFQKERINHLLHLVLSVLTLGLWLIVWVAVGIANSSKPSRCVTCGEPKPFVLGKAV